MLVEGDYIFEVFSAGNPVEVLSVSLAPGFFLLPDHSFHVLAPAAFISDTPAF